MRTSITRRLVDRHLKGVQKGFALLELIVAVSVSALLAVYVSSEVAKRSEESIAEGAGIYIAAVAGAAEQHVLLNFNEYANGTAVAGVAVPLRPTVAELVALGRLNPGFPAGAGALPTRQTLRIDVIRTACPGPGCTLTALACTTTPVTLGGAQTRFDLASTMVQVQGGRGGQSLPNAGGFIRGPVLNVPNPMGAVEGVVCGSASVDTALFQRFLTVRDTRDPDLQGPLTVAGPVTFNSTTQLNGAATINGNATVTGRVSAGGDTNVGTCAQILAATGRAGFGCANPNDIPPGYVGGVRSPDVVASRRILASDNPAAFTGANGNYVYAGVEGGVAEVRTSGRAAADRLTPTGSYAPGAACAAADNGSIARSASAQGLVFCQGGRWLTLATVAAVGAACSPNGATAISATNESLLCVGGVWRSFGTLIRAGAAGTSCAAAGVGSTAVSSTGETLICKANPADATGSLIYYRLSDLTNHLTFVRSEEVTHGSSIVRPNCAAPAPFNRGLTQLIPKTFSSANGGFDIRVSETASNWTVRLTQAGGAAMTGTPLAIAQIYCYFP
jgi:prepilin-type N-terminal cleavage/methylation domain-containing protein